MSAAEKIGSIKDHVADTIVGLSDAIEILLVGMLTGGHVLVEGPPGLGKTTLARTFSHSIGGSFNRIQMTPDLLPSDVLGVNVYSPIDYTWVLRRGPVFANVVLIDELNRASPKVQSAFLQVMQEREVTIENETLAVPEPFMIIGTQLPVGELGTYPLTSVQIDRFAYRITLENPSVGDEVEVLRRVDSIDAGGVEEVVSGEDILDLRKQLLGIHVEDIVLGYIVDLVHSIRSNRYVRLGPSPRASIWLYRGARALALIEKRGFVIPDDVKKLVPYVIPHRVELTQEARLDNVDVMQIVEETLGRVKVHKGFEQ